MKTIKIWDTARLTNCERSTLLFSPVQVDDLGIDAPHQKYLVKGISCEGPIQKCDVVSILKDRKTVFRTTGAFLKNGEGVICDIRTNSCELRVLVVGGGTRERVFKIVLDVVVE